MSWTLHSRSWEDGVMHHDIIIFCIHTSTQKHKIRIQWKYKALKIPHQVYRVHRWKSAHIKSICVVLFNRERLAVGVSKWEQLSPLLFVCPSHVGCSRCPVWISFNVNLLSLSIRIQLNVRATRAALPCLFLCALPEWTSTGYGNIGSVDLNYKTETLQISLLQVHINECFWHWKTHHQPADICLHLHKACT